MRGSANLKAAASKFVDPETQNSSDQSGQTNNLGPLRRLGKSNYLEPELQIAYADLALAKGIIRNQKLPTELDRRLGNKVEEV